MWALLTFFLLKTIVYSMMCFILLILYKFFVTFIWHTISHLIYITAKHDTFFSLYRKCWSHCWRFLHGDVVRNHGRLNHRQIHKCAVKVPTFYVHKTVLWLFWYVFNICMLTVGSHQRMFVGSWGPSMPRGFMATAELVGCSGTSWPSTCRARGLFVRCSWRACGFVAS